MPTLIEVLAATGQTVYVVIRNALAQIWNTNTNAFETFNSANWSKYAISAIEQTGSASYFAKIPLGITTPGSYSFAGFIQSGGSPVEPPTDTPATPGNFVIPVPPAIFSVPSSLTALIASMRLQVKDGATSKGIWGERLGVSNQPSFPVDGVNTTFRLSSAPLSDAAGAASYTYVTIIGTGAQVRSQSGFTIVDQVNGIIQFSVAPNPGGSAPANGVFVDYYWQWFTDAEYAQFLYQAAQLTLAGTTDPTTIPSGLSAAMMQFALAQFWYARSSQYAEKYAAHAGDSGESVNTVSDAYKKLGDAAYKMATNERDEYYKRQGQRYAPASGDIQHNWDPITPMR